MPIEPHITREIPPLPTRRDDAHKGDAGRIIVIGGCSDDLLMVGGPALTSNAAFRSGAGMVQLLVPEDVRATAVTLAPCATARSLLNDAEEIMGCVHDYRADVLAIGPGLGQSISPDTFTEVVTHFAGPVVIDADGLNLLAKTKSFNPPNPQRLVLTPHVGEAERLLKSRDLGSTPIDTIPARHQAVCTLARSFQCTVVLKGRGTLVTNGERLYVNDTGNPGMATAGTGDVLTGVIAALLGQKMEPLEAAMLGVYLHGLAGDFTAEELGRLSMTAADIVEYLPDAFCDHESATMGQT